MQLAPQPATLPTNPLQPLLSAVRPQKAAPIETAAPAQAAPSSAAESAAAAAAAASGSASPAVEEASLSQRLLGKVGSAQQRSLENQQMLGAISAMFGARLSMIGSHVMRLLKGDVQQPAGE